jgi:hypothetical protein
MDFLHIQYIDIMPYWRHSKTRKTKRIYLNFASTAQDFYTLTCFKVLVVELNFRLLTKSVKPIKKMKRAADFGFKAVLFSKSTLCIN